MRLLISVLVVAFAPLLGLFPLTACNPCKLTDDPDCDRTKLTNPCGKVCAPSEGESGQSSNDEKAVDSGIQDGSND